MAECVVEALHLFLLRRMIWLVDILFGLASVGLHIDVVLDERLAERLDPERTDRGVRDHFVDEFGGQGKQVEQSTLDIVPVLCFEEDLVTLATMLCDDSRVQMAAAMHVTAELGFGLVTGVAGLVREVLRGSEDDHIIMVWVCIAPVLYIMSVNTSSDR
jgi:hypothetical protein